MSENMSQNTENDFLDQTFKDIDSSVSLEENDDHGTQEVAKPAEKKSGMNKNAIMIGGVALGAVAIVGYWFLTAGRGQQQAQPQQAQQTQQAANTPAEAPPAPTLNLTEPPAVEAPAQTPEQPSSSVPVAPTSNDSLLAQAPAPAADPFAMPSTNTPAPDQNQNIPSMVMPDPVPPLSEPVQSTSAVAASNEVNSVLQGATNNPVPSSQNITAPVQTTIQTIAPAVEPIQAIANNAPQTAHVDELRSLFEKHSVEIDKLDIRVTALEAKFDKSIQEQMAINKRVEDRLAKLEAGGASVARVNNSNNSNAGNANSGSGVSSSTHSDVKKNTQRKRVKKASAQKQVVAKTTTSKVTVSNEPKVDSTTLVDKRDVVSAAKPSQQSMEIHSVFSGRVWIKNPDSTLSTFAVGEATPNGEKIKRIDENGRKIYTDKRAISY